MLVYNYGINWLKSIWSGLCDDDYSWTSDYYWYEKPLNEDKMSKIICTLK